MSYPQSQRRTLNPLIVHCTPTFHKNIFIPHKYERENNVLNFENRRVRCCTFQFKNRVLFVQIVNSTGLKLILMRVYGITNLIMRPVK